MTNEEALEIIDDTLGAGRISAEAENIAFWETVRAAVEKQIPKKPKKVKHYNCCPLCGATQYDEEIGQDIFCDFCSECGQRLDWRE